MRMIFVIAFKSYYVREMIAALALFSGLFVAVALSVLAFLALDHVINRTFSYASFSAVWLLRRATSSMAVVEKFRKRRFNNLHSRAIDDSVMAVDEAE